MTSKEEQQQMVVDMFDAERDRTKALSYELCTDPDNVTPELLAELEEANDMIQNVVNQLNKA